MDNARVQAWLRQHGKSGDPIGDYIIAADPPGSAPRLIRWNSAKLGPAPTEEDLAAITTQDLDAADTTRARTEAQGQIDTLPIPLKAIALTLVDQLNTIRAALPSPLQPITPAQALAAIRAKAGTL